MSKPIALCWDIDVAPAQFDIHLIRVENQAGKVGEYFDACFGAFRSAMRAIKSAEMSIYLHDSREYRKNVESGANAIASALNSASGLVASLEQMLRMLRNPPNRNDFAFRREKVFRDIAYAKLRETLLRRQIIRGNEPWSAMVAAFSRNGCDGALGVLRRLALQIRVGVSREAAGFRKLARVSGESALRLLRTDIAGTVAVHTSFCDFMNAAAFFTLVVEQASHLLLSRDRASSAKKRRRQKRQHS